MMRRLFFRNAAAGAAAAPILLSGASKMPNGPGAPPPVMPYRGDVFANEASQTFDPLRAIKEAKRMDYNKSMSAIRIAQDRKHQLKFMLSQPDLNIAALKSVSNQHKAIMNQNILDSMIEERKSWKDRLLEQLGLKREDVYDNEPLSASSY